MIYKDVLSRIGNTPLVEINRLNPYRSDVKILAKTECVNPGGSIKDRVALTMIEAAERSGELTPEKTIIEATSGNTGIGLAMVAAVKGYKLTLLMSERASEERKMIVRAYGANILLTPGHLSTDGAIEKAYRMAREEPEKYLLMDQFNNPASIEAHYLGTGLEIWEQTKGEVTHVVVALGTTGTCMGITKRMREMNPSVQVVGVEPHAGHKIQGLKNMHESYPPGIWDKHVPDRVVRVDDDAAFEYCLRLAREEGIFAGMSSGAALAASVELARELSEKGESGHIVTIFPDSGERYLSTPLFSAGAVKGLALRNAATAKDVDVTASGKRGLYVVGPSLDEPEELGAWRRVVLLDVLARALEERGADVHAAVGLMDLDDRAMRAAREAGRSRAGHAKAVRAGIQERAALFGVRPQTAFPLASEFSEQSVALTRKLTEKGLAYEKLRSVYFDVLRDDRYGAMALQDVDKISAGKTVDLDDYVKANPLDFTLLKRASLQDLKEGEVLETSWGNVRPTWFLQVAAAGFAALPSVDVFLADESQSFPHLENLRAIWSVAGREVQAWMLGQQTVVEDGLRFEDLLQEAGHPLALRMWLLSGSYHKTQTATLQAVGMWARNWRRVQDAAATLALAQAAAGDDVPQPAQQAVFDLKTGLSEAVDNDLSLHRFWPALFKFVKDVHQLESSGRLTGAAAKVCLRQLRAVDRVLGILDAEALPVSPQDLPESVRALVGKRQVAREAKDFAASDALREELAAQGYRVEDSPKGPRIYKM
ncbi:cysteinyl-tRNA synthetase [Paucidesulfovibrio gracilis DSM 16080]|uniref:cysteine synthase n=1 Tax=Paucidesulfovibrio gracilis DSM 16080 TaxID=1121449 RepID=A0A1T4WC04_9BACT|nr:cysteine synthase [Paucidesulfovibrio gracilis]SKA74465.1 cysteinyl-tRNA synthetase [Paucidesulfovibrio gracilis DSM 16080]